MSFQEQNLCPYGCSDMMFNSANLFRHVRSCAVDYQGALKILRARNYHNIDEYDRCWTNGSNKIDTRGIGHRGRTERAIYEFFHDVRLESGQRFRRSCDQIDCVNPTHRSTTLIFTSNYHIIHKYVRTTRGSASSYACVSCRSQAQEWAYNYQDPDDFLTTVDLMASRRPEFYEPMCKPCHRKYDSAWRKNAISVYRSSLRRGMIALTA
jgi:hypothetical protein